MCMETMYSNMVNSDFSSGEKDDFVPFRFLE
mgnify:CR=1 FL=1